MKQFEVVLHSFQDVHDFVAIATVQPFRVLVGNDRSRVSAKSFMGMFSLDFSEPILVRAHCTDEEFEAFRAAAAEFLA